MLQIKLNHVSKRGRRSANLNVIPSLPRINSLRQRLWLTKTLLRQCQDKDRNQAQHHAFVFIRINMDPFVCGLVREERCSSSISGCIFHWTIYNIISKHIVCAPINSYAHRVFIGPVAMGRRAMECLLWSKLSLFNWKNTRCIIMPFEKHTGAKQTSHISPLWTSYGAFIVT